MDPSFTPDRQSQLSDLSSVRRSRTPASPSSWLSLTHYRKSSVVTPATQYSSSSSCWGTASAGGGHRQHPSRTSTLDLGRPHPPAQNLQRKTSILSWSLFRSKYRQHVERQSPTDETRREVGSGSRWWPSSAASEVARKKKLRISPPIPRRPPESLHFPKRLSRSDSQLVHHELLRGLSKDQQQQSKSPTVLLPKPHDDDARSSLQLADLDPDKRGPAFARINPDGWSKIIPKQWMEDQFSDSDGPSDAGGSDDGRSVYSQSNGEEEGTNRKLVVDPFAIENGEEQQDHPVTLSPPTEAVERPAACAFGGEKSTNATEDLSTRYWDEDSRAGPGSASSDPVRYWMSSLRELPEPRVSPRTPLKDTDYETDADISSPCESRRWNKRPHHEGIADPLSSDLEPSTGLENAIGAVDPWHYRDVNQLVPQPLRLSRRRRGTSPAATAYNSNHSESKPQRADSGHLCVLNEHPEAKSLQSSWSTIYCAGGTGVDGDDTSSASAAASERQVVAHRPFTEPLTRQFKDKALPPLPSPWPSGSSSESVCSTRDGCGHRPRRVISPKGRRTGWEQGEEGKDMDKDAEALAADIDEILDMYLPMDPFSSSAPAPTSQPTFATTARETVDVNGKGQKNRSRSRTKPTQDTYTDPPKRPVRSFATDPDLGVGVVNSQATARFSTRGFVPVPGPVRPWVYDPERYPELRHGRGREERLASRERPPDVAAPAAVTGTTWKRSKPMASVDEDGQIWI
ncbi:uncharacterized protein Z520_04173 [Fonsecaea multimorphosa CBS 102226]|uniref:Uncharacterized protein n=1 Tax=Fonsecaea multimorphosa CBS 102226 TaxID=1442371 RepID=A0A0D2K3V5_9EURO|nr:uncharacterized protein Z520_04173 [Fonsecaea multimorphosa CBS 102226]KIY00488.1 hypothetical protein Z520_04173 [Fonsecaea multimorphosa CBS 102226]OAL27002.1 hypothetical protein AYO22_03946 [Fonsecaea multimorphosa]